MNQNEKALTALKGAKTTTFRSQGRKVNQDDDMVRVQFDMPINEFRSFVKALESQPVAGQVSGDVVDINGHEIEAAVDEAWDKNAVDFLGVEQRSMTYREFVTAGYEIAKTVLALRTQQPQAPAVDVSLVEDIEYYLGKYVSTHEEHYLKKLRSIISTLLISRQGGR